MTRSPNHPFRRFFGSLAKWVWLGFFVLLTLGYLSAGLSKSEFEPASLDGRRTADSNSPISDSPTAAINDSLTNNDSDANNDSIANKEISSNLALWHSDSDLATSVALVDAARDQSIRQAQLISAEPADWLTVCRRISLALVGSGMSVEEIRALQHYPSQQRPQIHLDDLLVDSRFHHYWAERYTRFLVGTDEGPFIVYRRRRFRTWLAEALEKNRPYDQIVRDLITAEGLWTDRPEVNFYTVTFDSGEKAPDPIRLAARTSRAFLGLRIDCLQCHNDFLGNVNLGDVTAPREGLQTDFHQLAAFFTSAKYNGLQGIRNGKSEYRYQYLDASEEIDVLPSVPYSAKLLPEKGNDRNRLATWITHPENRQAARAAVSHIWALMYGRPAGDAVDNLPVDEPSTPMLETLTDDFVAHRFNIKRLIRVIVGSAAFRVDSRADFEVTPRHEAIGAVFPLVRLRPEQVAGCVLQSARIKKTDRESSLFVQLQTFGQSNNFVRRYGDLGEDEFTSDSVTITQRLLTMNGKMLRELTAGNPILNASSHITMFARDDTNAIEMVYLSVLNRFPSDEEMAHFVKQLGEASNRNKMIEDLFWVLLNSTELAWNH